MGTACCPFSSLARAGLANCLPVNLGEIDTTAEHSFTFHTGGLISRLRAAGSSQISDSSQPTLLNDVGTTKKTLFVSPLTATESSCNNSPRRRRCLPSSSLWRRGSTRKHVCHQNDIELLSDKAHCTLSSWENKHPRMSHHFPPFLQQCCMYLVTRSI